MILTLLLILLVTSILFGYLYTTRNFNYWKKKGVVFSKPLPFIGNLLDLITVKKSPGQFLDALYNKWKDQPYVGFFALDKPALLIRDIDIIKNILIKDFNFFKDRYVSVSPDDTLGYSNLFIMKNPAWKYVRTKLTPIYTTGRLKLMFERMLEVGHDLNTYLDSLGLTGSLLNEEKKKIILNIDICLLISIFLF